VCVRCTVGAVPAGWRCAGAAGDHAAVVSAC
jgi:hypothetical protein